MTEYIRRDTQRAGALDCAFIVEGTVRLCGLAATTVNHYSFISSKPFVRFVHSWPLCDEHTDVVRDDPEAVGRYEHDFYVPLVRPGTCDAVDDCIARFCAELCAFAPSAEEAA